MLLFGLGVIAGAAAVVVLACIALGGINQNGPPRF